MKKITRILIILLCVSLLATCLTGCAKKKTVTVIINDGEGNELYNKQLTTKAENLFDAVKESDIDFEYEDSDYGAYITAMMGIEQTFTEEASFYWSYSINGAYAEVGITECVLEDGSVYTFDYLSF